MAWLGTILRRIRTPVLKAAWPLIIVTAPLLVAQLAYAGDGSASNNPDLVQNASGCAVSCMSAPDPMAPPPVIVTSDRLLPGGQARPLMLDPGLTGMPPEGDAPYMQVDWSVSLRGSYVESSKGSLLSTSLIPEFTLSHESRRGVLDIDASADLALDQGQQPRVAGFDLGLNQSFVLDPVTQVTLTGDLSVSQQSASEPDVPRNVVAPPLEIDGLASATLARQFGRFGLEATADIERFWTSDTVLRTRTRSNTDQMYWAGGGALRAGYAVTPILTPFVEGGVHYTRFDAALVSTGIKLDGWEYAMNAGLAANWKDVLTGEISAGYSIRQFDAASLADLGSIVYAADLAFTPGETISFGIGGSTAFNPAVPSAGSVSSVTYEGSADAAYMLNQWVTLRGSISATFTQPQTGIQRTLGYGAGVGADLLLNENSALTFDYAYDQSHTISQPIEQAHEFTLGVTFSR